jgi:hypothetical protein
LKRYCVVESIRRYYGFGFNVVDVVEVVVVVDVVVVVVAGVVVVGGKVVVVVDVVVVGGNVVVVAGVVVVVAGVVVVVVVVVFGTVVVVFGIVVVVVAGSVVVVLVDVVVVAGSVVVVAGLRVVVVVVVGSSVVVVGFRVVAGASDVVVVVSRDTSTRTAGFSVVFVSGVAVVAVVAARGRVVSGTVAGATVGAVLVDFVVVTMASVDALGELVTAVVAGVVDFTVVVVVRTSPERAAGVSRNDFKTNTCMALRSIPGAADVGEVAGTVGAERCFELFGVVAVVVVRTLVVTATADPLTFVVWFVVWFFPVVGETVGAVFAKVGDAPVVWLEGTAVVIVLGSDCLPEVGFVFEDDGGASEFATPAARGASVATGTRGTTSGGVIANESTAVVSCGSEPDADTSAAGEAGFEGGASITSPSTSTLGVDRSRTFGKITSSIAASTVTQILIKYKTGNRRWWGFTLISGHITARGERTVSRKRFLGSL